ncbi:MAG: AAA family ATPase [Acidimicrobiaceae bacterium]|nr:AAA family ATPase [Acidimicrobiaceae bacterium]
MERFIKVLRSDAEVSDDQAKLAFRFLIPIVETDPTAAEAVEASRQLIQRCVPSEDSPLASVLDWWFVATTGESSANKGAHRLPDSLDESVRLPMEATMRLNSTLPAAEWLDKKRLLGSQLRGLDDALNLDHYGAVKLGGERVAWAWLEEQLRPSVQLLKSNQRATTVEADRSDFEKRMRENDIDRNSHRWKEMVNRYTEAVGAVNRAVELQHSVEPWVPRGVPEVLAELPSDLTLTVGQLATALLRPLLTANAASRVDRQEVAQRLEEAARAADGPGRYRLARIAFAWWQETGQRVPSLAGLLERHQALREAVSSLERRHDADTSEVQIHVMDDDIAAAEAAVEGLRTEVDRRERIQRTRRQYDGLEQKLREAGLQDDSDWQHRLHEFEGRLQGLDSGLDDSDPQELVREIAAAQRQLNAQLDEMLQERLDDLEHLVDLLAAFRAADSMLFDWRRRIREIQSEPGGRGANDLKRELEAEAERLRLENRAGLEERLSEIGRILEEEANEFSETHRGSFDNRHSEIDSLLHEVTLDDDDLIDARKRVEALRAELDEHRLHRWHASDGEASLVQHLVAYCTGDLDFDHTDIRRLHVAVKTKPFVILAGLTGSGKSSLTRLYAQALGADSANGGFRRVAVRPDWIDQSEVLGFVNPVSRRFVPGWLAETVRRCESRPDRLHFVLLDEMNLAPVEQYLAELLSAMEEARSGSHEVWLPLYARGEEPENRDEWPHELRYPENLVVVGTVNVDETTRPLSERVIDRANVLHLSVGVSDAHHGANGESETPWHVDFGEWRKICESEPSDAHHEFLVDVAGILRSAGVGVGLRAHVELERFIANAVGVIDSVSALDWGIVQRIIPRIRGFKASMTAALEELLAEFEALDATESAAIVRRWLDEGVSDDEYLDGTDPKLTLARAWGRDDDR